MVNVALSKPSNLSQACTTGEVRSGFGLPTTDVRGSQSCLMLLWGLAQVVLITMLKSLSPRVCFEAKEWGLKLAVNSSPWSCLL
mmetsp:Transcript_9999/g.30696  ORF Transcript_9999/g.30696 Transcript_9999/m.30696 type:complete len:84 (+) Transcript_9999:993-1244(+)|eukprot:scaffold118740_cov30-Tisochrysis_lutea.AAC.4